MDLASWLLFAVWLVLVGVAARSLFNSVRQYRAVRQVRRERIRRGRSHPLQILDAKELDALVASPRGSTVWLTSIPDPWRSGLVLERRVYAVYANLLRQRADLLKWATELVVGVGAVFAGVFAGDLLESLRRGDSVQMLVAGLPLIVMAAGSMFGLTVVPSWRAASERYRALARETDPSRSSQDEPGQDQGGDGSREEGGPERQGALTSGRLGPQVGDKRADGDRPPHGGEADSAGHQTDDTGELDVAEANSATGRPVQQPESCSRE